LVEQIQHYITHNFNSVLERVRLVWVIDTNVRQELLGADPQKQAEEQLNQVQAQLAGLNLVVNTSIIQGDPLKEIMFMAEIHDIGAIAACSSGNGFLRWSVPSMTREILRRSWHPVLYFPS
jgi:nucleotide-binding universal stress UspA family protein